MFPSPLNARFWAEGLPEGPLPEDERGLPEDERGLHGELPPLALEHVDPAPSLKPGRVHAFHPDDLER